MNEKGKITTKFVLFIVCVIIGLLFKLEYNSMNEAKANGIYQNSVDDLKKRIAEIEIQKSELNDQLIKSKNNLNVSQNELQNFEEKLAEMQKEIDNFKVMAATTTVKGDGIRVSIENPDDNYAGINIYTNYLYLLSIVSNLNSAGAEAISINDIRYNAYTEIIPVGDTLNVGGKKIVAPIKIEAIGNSRTLNASINFMGGIIEQMKGAGFSVDVEQIKDIVMQPSLKKIDFEYAQPYDLEN